MHDKKFFNGKIFFQSNNNQPKNYEAEVNSGSLVRKLHGFRRIVRPGSDGKNFIVTAGLTPGEVIVTEGVGLMREGTPIKPKGAATTATAPAEQPTKEQ